MTKRTWFWIFASAIRQTRIASLCALLLWSAILIPAPASGASYLTFPVPQGWNVLPASVNDAPAVTGSWSIGQGPSHGFFVAWPNTVFSFDPPGSVNTTPVSINFGGAIAGTYTGTDNRYHGFVRDPQGNFTTFDVKGALWTRVASLNDLGYVTGSWNYSSSDAGDGYVRDPQGKIDTFSLPTSTEMRPHAINDFGVITGTYNDWNLVNPRWRGFVRDANGIITTFDGEAFPSETNAVAINLFGTITGYYKNLFGRRVGFVRNGAAKLPFEADPEAVSTEPVNISGWTGDITGSYLDIKNVRHGFVRLANGKITPFDPPNSQATFPTSIDDWGIIVGYYLDATGTYVGFVRIP